jgi:hypothetical protein
VVRAAECRPDVRALAQASGAELRVYDTPVAEMPLSDRQAVAGDATIRAQRLNMHLGKANATLAVSRLK